MTAVVRYYRYGNTQYGNSRHESDGDGSRRFGKKGCPSHGGVCEEIMSMSPATERAYRAYRRAADTGYGNPRPSNDTPGRMARIDDRIRRLKARYEALLARDKYNRIGWT